MKQEEFFNRIGGHALHPTAWGDCIYDVTVEELYQAFKERLMAEVVAKVSITYGEAVQEFLCKLVDEEGEE